MPTTKHRINITTSKSTEEILKLSAKRDGMTVAGKVSRMLEDALEREEDLLWAKIADQRLSEKNPRFVSHKDAWKQFTSK